MEKMDLISFDSPEKIKESSKKRISHSPGSNPFDTFSKNADSEFVVVENMEYFAECDEQIAGRESLGILKLESLNTSFKNDHYLNIPSPSDQNSKDIINDSLNIAYLRIPSVHTHFNSTSRSCFNSESLEGSELSPVCSVNFGHLENNLNEAFLSNNSQLKPESVSTSRPSAVSQNADVVYKRTLSLPEFKKNVTDIEQNYKEEFSDSNFDNLDDFNNSVFIEANDVASKIADGSLIINKKSLSEISLDCVSPPKFIDLDQKLPNDNLDVMFKKIDHLIPNDSNANNSSPCLNGAGTSNTVLPEKEQIKQSLSNIFNNEKKSQCCNSGSSNGSSLDPNEILFNLSAIINNEHRNPKQNEEGQQLLFSLADILCAEKVQNKCDDNFNDSGHSSIEQEDQNDQHGCNSYQVLDLRVVSKSHDDMQALDLSMKTNRDDNKRLSQSFTLPSPPKLLNRLKSQSTSSSSISISQLSNNKNDFTKLKPKKIDDKRKSAKGPLKAVLSVVDMAKRRASDQKSAITNITPAKLIVGKSSLVDIKRTSTPINEPHVKPVAQSTPGTRLSTLDRNKPNACSSQLKKRKFYCPVSPLVLQNSSQNNSIDLASTKSSQGSTSTPNLSNQSRKDSIIPSPKFMYRRHSASELKTGDKKPSLTRSYSIGSGNIVNKLKKSVSGVTNSPVKKNVLSPVQTNAVQDNNRGIVKNMKSLSLLGKLRRSKSNKEN